ncbi:unnamed protein product [Adineta steineri]|uniref:Uncharacterized protein n=2 Tax=Adineta steineri TaxID=433720 RepID=A0A815UWD7_9BILA|nr:unnamed protein product [Adineta steineri]
MVTKRCIILLVSEVLVNFIVAALLFVCVKSVAKHRILKIVELKPNSKGFETWLNPSTTITRGYHLFNITNPAEIVADPSTVKIHVQDTPPYVYNIKTKKNNVQWSNNNKKLDYEVERLFTRDETKFNPSSVNDTGVFINLLRATLRAHFGRIPDPNFYTLAAGETVFNHGNAIEQLEGFTSELFNTTVRDKMKGPNTEKFGFIYRNNGSRLYSISIKTDSAEKGQVNTFDNDLVDFKISSPSHYSFPVYDGLTYPPMLLDKPILNIFNSDFCAPVLLKFNKVTTMFGTMRLHEYKIKLIDINDCTNLNDTSTCTEVDKLDVSKCVSSSLPEEIIFLSKAHFYGSKDEVIEKMNIDGLKPSSDKHDSTVYFEPYTGTLLQATIRMQLNVEVMIDPHNPSDDTNKEEKKKMKKATKRLVPFYWFDEDIKLSEKVIAKLKDLPISHLDYEFYITLGLGLALSTIIIGIINCLVKRAYRNTRSNRGTYVQADTLMHH